MSQLNEEDALQELARGFASMAIGDKFFKSLAQYLAKALAVDYIFIGELTHEKKHVRSIAFYAKDRIVDNIEYPLVGSLCEEVVKPNFCAYPSHVQELFPENKALKHFGVDSYVGTPLFDSYGNVLGLIYLMHSKPLDNLTKIESLLGIVAKRAELELEREQHERWLQQANQELEQRVARRTSALSKSEEALAQKMEQLQRMNDDLENFIYTASHDLKSPITNIEGLINVLTSKLSKEGWEDETTRGVLEMIRGSIGRFKGTIADLTQISKISQENGQVNGKVNVADTIEEVLLDMRREMEETGVQLVVAVKDCPQISFSKKNLKSVISNLLSNSIKYRALDRPAHIQVSCHQTLEYIVLSIQDNGLGIDETKKNKIFAMFTRLHTHVEGSGIGLYMVKKILENAAGRIKVESKVGEGSTFSAYFKK
jgi:signal transduction histidine kinase